jgi:hypothetical protein
VPACEGTAGDAGLPGSGSAGGTRTGGEPPRWWTVPLPCLLTLLVSAWGLSLGAVADISSTAGGPPAGPLPAIGVAEFIAGVISIGMLITGLAWRAGRRMLRRVLWTACLLAWLGLGVMYAWTAAHP